MDTKLTKEQRVARVAILLSLRESLTDEELALLQKPYSEWTPNMVKKTGPLARLAEFEDWRAEHTTVETSASQDSEAFVGQDYGDMRDAFDKVGGWTSAELARNAEEHTEEERLAHNLIVGVKMIKLFANKGYTDFGLFARTFASNVPDGYRAARGYIFGMWLSARAQGIKIDAIDEDSANAVLAAVDKRLDEIAPATRETAPAAPETPAATPSIDDGALGQSEEASVEDGTQNTDNEPEAPEEVEEADLQSTIQRLNQTPDGLEAQRLLRKMGVTPHPDKLSVLELAIERAEAEGLDSICQRDALTIWVPEGSAITGINLWMDLYAIQRGMTPEIAERIMEGSPNFSASSDEIASAMVYSLSREQAFELGLLTWE